MLIIRKEQLEAMQDAMLPQFDAEAAAYLRTYFPEQTAELDGEQLRAVVSAGKRHARAYGVDSPAALLQFIGIRFALGDDFDTDPRYERIAAPLRETFYPDAGARVEEMAHRVRELFGEEPKS